MGFDNDLGAKYEIGDDSALPLREFVDYLQIDNWLYEDAMLQFQCEEATMTFVRIVADPVPRIVSFSVHPTTISLARR